VSGGWWCGSVGALDTCDTVCVTAPPRIVDQPRAGWA
jgi:hypothetical protein